MKTSEKIDIISKALLQAQRGIGSAVKGSENPFFHSKYADFSEVIKAVKEPLNNSGISFLQLVQSSEVDEVVWPLCLKCRHDPHELCIDIVVWPVQPAYRVLAFRQHSANERLPTERT